MAVGRAVELGSEVRLSLAAAAPPPVGKNMYILLKIGISRRISRGSSARLTCLTLIEGNTSKRAGTCHIQHQSTEVSKTLPCCTGSRVYCVAKT